MNWKSMVVAFVLPPLVLLVLGLTGHLSEWMATTLGGTCQLGGVGLVYLGLSKVNREHGKGTLLQQVRQAARRCWAALLGRKSDVVIQPQSGHLRFTAFEAHIVQEFDPTRPVDDRLASLETAVTGLQEGAGKFHDKLTEQRKEARAALSEEQQARDQGDEQLSSEIAKLAIGDTIIDLAGVALFAWGIVFVTWAADIPRLFG